MGLPSGPFARIELPVGLPQISLPTGLSPAMADQLAELLSSRNLGGLARFLQHMSDKDNKDARHPNRDRLTSVKDFFAYTQDEGEGEGLSLIRVGSAGCGSIAERQRPGDLRGSEAGIAVRGCAFSFFAPSLCPDHFPFSAGAPLTPPPTFTRSPRPAPRQALLLRA